MQLYRKIAYLFVLLCFTSAAAQDAACGPFVQQAMSLAEQGCQATGRNQACYGYFALQATARTGVQNLTFSQEGDIVNLADLSSIQLTALNTAQNTWGIALMKVQANLPDSLPGENVTFLMFGDVQIRNAVASDQATPQASALQPMQAFYFKTGVGQTSCAGAPADGLLIQTPKGAGQIKLRANDVDIQLGSTAYLQAQPGAHMSIKVIEGKGHVTAGGKTVIVPAGSEAEIPMNEDMSADGEPTDPQPYDEGDVADLPIDGLPDEITIAPPADQEEIQQAIDEASLEATDQAPDFQTGDVPTDQAPDFQSGDVPTDQSSDFQSGDAPTDQSPPADSSDGSDG